VRYYLKSDAAKELRMTFYEADGDSIISYSSLYDVKRTPVVLKDAFYPNPKFTEPGKLNAYAGMHQFIWDMRYPEAKGDTSATFDASLQGPLAVPGKYYVQVYVGDSLVGREAFVIRKDPRNPSTQEELQAQFDLNMRICEKLNQIALANATVHQVQELVKQEMEEQTDPATQKLIREKGQALIAAMTAIEEQLHNPRILAYEDNLKFPIMLEEKLAGLNWFLQFSDAGPTKSMLDKYADLSARIQVQFDALDALLQKEIPELNALLDDPIEY